MLHRNTEKVNKNKRIAWFYQPRKRYQNYRCRILTGPVRGSRTINLSIMQEGHGFFTNRVRGPRTINLSIMPIPDRRTTLLFPGAPHARGPKFLSEDTS